MPTRRARMALAGSFLAAAVVSAAGCGGGGGNGTPNPDLKVPDVPAGRGQEKSGAPKDIKAKKT